MLNLKTVRVILILLFLCMILWDIFLYLSPDKATNANYLLNFGYSFIYIFGGIAGIIGAIKTDAKTNIGRMFIFFGIGLISYAIGLWVWTYYNIILEVAAPYPAISDIFFLSLYPLVLIGFYNALKIYKLSLTTDVVIQSVIIFLIIVAVLLVSQNILIPQGEVTPLVFIFNTAYQLVDALLVAVAATALKIGGGSTYKGARYFIFAFILQAVADYTFAYTSAKGIYWNGSLADTLYITVAFVFSLGIISSLIQQSSSSVQPS